MNLSFSRRSVRDTGGQAIAEFAMVLPLMLFLFLGMIEVGNALAVSHTLGRLTREGANIASRGASLDTVLTVVAYNGQDIHLDERGGSVVSRIAVRTDGVEILAQTASPGFDEHSRLGTIGADPVSFASYGLEAGNTHYVVEIFYTYKPITPFARLFKSALPDPLYERAVF